ncbi:MAG TPA: polyhydroxyalkanoate synthesis regulator [Firmicutes bacterium]|nr:polyhydroxyalkanoate synthesis regulator [Bacillota bacterium]
MESLLRKAMLLGIGALSMTKEALEKGIDELVKKGEVSQEEAREMMRELWERGQKERDNLTRLVREQTERALKAFKGASREDLAALEARVAALERRLGLSPDQEPAAPADNVETPHQENE